MGHASPRSTSPIPRPTRSCPSGTDSGSSRPRRRPSASSRSPARTTTTSCGWLASAMRGPFGNSRPCSVAGDNLLFVYGTLMRGFPLHALLERRATYLGEATTPGLLLDLGSYPAALKSATGKIRGEVYRLTDPGLWRALDSAEGSQYHREQAGIEQASGGR